MDFNKSLLHLPFIKGDQVTPLFIKEGMGEISKIPLSPPFVKGETTGGICKKVKTKVKEGKAGMDFNKSLLLPSFIKR